MEGSFIGEVFSLGVGLDMFFCLVQVERGDGLLVCGDVTLLLLLRSELGECLEEGRGLMHLVGVASLDLGLARGESLEQSLGMLYFVE